MGLPEESSTELLRSGNVGAGRPSERRRGGRPARRPFKTFVFGFLLLALFVKRCATVSDPLLDLSLFKLPFVVAANLSGLFFSIGFLGMWLLNTQWLQAIWHYSPAKSGLAIAPGPIMAATLAAPMGRLAMKWGHARVLMLGSVLLSFGTVMFSITIEPTPHYVTDLHATLLHQLGLNGRKLEVPDRKRLDVDYGEVIRPILA